MLDRNILAALLLLVLAAAPGAAARAMTAEEYFEDGNRLFRDDLYWAALLRYRQAGDAGLDTALLHYNEGIAHYRARQYDRARDALQRALDDPRLRDPARYNLGLNAYAQGQTDEALRWFWLVRDQAANDKLRDYAAVAIARIRDEQAQPDEFAVRIEERRKKRDFTDLELRARVGFGSDDNAFRSPSQPYFDLSDPNAPLVVPEVQSGAYIPVNLFAKYQVNSLPFEGFYGAYRMSGHFYQDQALENADEFLHEISFGSEYQRQEEGRERILHSAFKIAQRDEVYYDPDDGGDREVGGVSVEDRMNYVRIGPELYFRQSGESLSFGFNGRAQLWNYEETGVLPEYDHEYFLASTFGQYRFTPSSLLRLTASYYSRRFGDRPSYDLDGRQRPGNPAMRYDYVSLAARARQRITDSMWFGFDVERTERTDQYVGYYDYTRDSFAFEFRWSPGERFDVDLRTEYRLYDYPNAFAFHNATAGRRTQETLMTGLLASYRITRNLSIVLDGRFEETVSNDFRIQYDRSRFSLGVLWEQ